ncbi:hypothetical protein V8E36_009593 [Tilletia maclaganii]
MTLRTGFWWTARDSAVATKAGCLELPKEQNEAMVDFVCRHFNMHTLLPTISGATLTAEQLRVQAATETYQYCHARGWARLGLPLDELVPAGRMGLDKKRVRLDSGSQD